MSNIQNHQDALRPASGLNHSPIRFLSLAKVIELTGLCKSSIYALHDFPKPIKITASRCKQGGARWVEHEVVEWQQSRINLRDLDSARLAQKKSAARKKAL